jgi:hypothetical protein
MERVSDIENLSTLFNVIKEFSVLSILDQCAMRGRE